MHFSHPIVVIKKALLHEIREILVETYRVKYPVKKNCVPMVAPKTAPNHLCILALSKGMYLITDTFDFHLSIKYYLKVYSRKYFRLGSKPNLP